MSPANPTNPSGPIAARDRDAAATVRYQVADIERSLRFYTEHLGFRGTERSGTAFAAVVRGPLRLILSGPGSSGSRPMPDGSLQQAGGWNRIVLYVADLAAQIQALERAGVRFRNQSRPAPAAPRS